jgi:hypothetical protein
MLKIIRSKEARQTAEDPSKVNGHNLSNIRCEDSKYFRNKKM